MRWLSLKSLHGGLNYLCGSIVAMILLLPKHTRFLDKKLVHATVNGTQIPVKTCMLKGASCGD